MDVQKFNFPVKLLDIITAVSESHFISFDLELSGVPVRPYGIRDRGKASLQERYAETKAAAERYAILQLGITCVKEDAIDGTYEIRPYNIHVSPLISERLDLDREFSFHSGAVQFLNSVGFNFQAPLAIGAPYLSAQEARQARERASDRLSRNKTPSKPLDVKAEEIETLAFLNRVRAAIKQWLKTGKPDRDALVLGPAELAAKGAPTTGPDDELSRFERRLVHEVVRCDFPDLVTGGAGAGAVQVMRLDQEREDKFRKHKLKEVDERIGRQKGLAWIVDAIAGRNLSKLDPRCFMDRIDEDGVVSTQAYVSFDIKSTFDRARSLIEGKPRPLIGHNLFLDLVYFYRHFVDRLPDTVEEFQRKIHELFPLVVDTKYMATHECGDMNPRSSLQELAWALDKQKAPKIMTSEKHGKYDDLDAHHEAGYDSMLTAQVAVRLSAKLEAERAALKTSKVTQTNGLLETIEHDEPAGGVDLPVEEISGSSLKKSVLLPVGVTKVAAVRSASRFAHTTPFDSLGNEDGMTGDEVLDFDTLPTSGSTAGREGRPDQWMDDMPSTTEQKDDSHDSGRKWVPFRLMPQWRTDFWQEYGNRLRVFGTEEGMCVLDGGA